MLPVPLQNDACWCEVRSCMHSHEAALEMLITDYTERERQGILCDMNFAWLVQVRSQTKPRELFFLITAPCISYIPWSDQPAGGLPQRCDKWLKHPGKTTDDASRRLTNIKAFWEPPHQKNVVVVVDPKAFFWGPNTQKKIIIWSSPGPDWMARWASFGPRAASWKSPGLQTTYLF